MVILTDIKYDVFLSFRGEDVRKNFADHLYKALWDAGINTFRDDDEIETGEELKSELERAIKESRASITVISKNYASSTWCLEELLLILERKKTSGSGHYTVLPIFYHVDPSDVRKQQKTFAKAFADHEEKIKAEIDNNRRRIRMEKMKQWKAALTELADLKAMVADKDVYETKFIEEIVEQLGQKLKQKVERPDRYLIGMRSRAEDINSWIRDGSSSYVADIYCIWGMGGIGKTTMAEYIHDSNFQGFECSSCLANIGSNSRKPNGLLELQKTLLGSICKRTKQEMETVPSGITKIEETMMTKRVLLVLDDIDDVDQLNALLGSRGFTPGSKIVITTREKSLPKQCGVLKTEVPSKRYQEHPLQELYAHQSLELLSSNAFGCKLPKEGYKELSWKLVNYCGGNPLALKILGSSLFGKDIALWKDMLRKLEKGSNSKIRNVLQTSYDSLQYDDDKEVFLHIACFFDLQDRDYIEKILEPDLCASSAIDNLIDRCLLSIRSSAIDNLIDGCLLSIRSSRQLTMHQLLQEMAKDIIRGESPKEPGRRSRLWCHEDSLNVLKKQRGTETIEGLILDLHVLEEKRLPKLVISSENTVSRPPNKEYLKTDAFKRMDKLIILQLNYVQLNGSYENFPETLKWLCWHGFPSESIPIGFPMENLVDLDMSFSKLKQFWTGPKWLESLKFLNLSDSLELVTFSYTSGLPNLERLILRRCTSLIEICESIENLKRLVLLDLKECKNLRKFPRDIRMLKSLQSLNIDGCSKLLKSLKKLDADDAVARISHFLVPSLPRFLVSLSLKNCNLSTKSFPMDFSGLSLLRNLNLSRNPIDSLPSCIQTLNGLTHLYLNKCQKLKYINETLYGLKRLYLRRCQKLKYIHGLPTSVEYLSIGYARSLEKVTFDSVKNSGLEIDDIDCLALTEIESVFKLEPILNADEEVINALGLSEMLGSMQNLRCCLGGPSLGGNEVKRPIQILHQSSIISTFFPKMEVPICFDHRNMGSSISFTVPMKHRIRGLNVCADYIRPHYSRIYPHGLKIAITNVTQEVEWLYFPFVVGIPEVDGDVVEWLSHWMIGDRLKHGDEIRVSVTAWDRKLEVKELGISFVYHDDDDDGEQLEEKIMEAKQGIESGILCACEDSGEGICYIVQAHVRKLLMGE